jgi:pyruvate dehydrogenase E2 component (dihydrolipoamide acetyltransferase)
MSSFTFHLPDIGEGVVEGEIVRVLVKEGDAIEEDQVMAEVMTDKATVQIPSPKKGVIEKVHVAAGQVVPVEAPMFTIALGGAQVAAPVQQAPAFDPGETRAVLPAVVVPQKGESDGRVLATPATRQFARDLGVDIKSVPGSGKDGRVTKDDVERAHRAPAAPITVPTVSAVTVPAPIPTTKFVAARSGVEMPPPPAVSPAQAKKPAPVAPVDATLEERIPLRGLRKTIAQNMVKAKFTAPHFTYVEEVDATPLVALRDRTRKLAEERGVKLSFLPFIVKAVVAGLKQFPNVNASFDNEDQEIVVKRYYHIGIATSTDNGLTVIVIRDADRKSILTIAREIDELAQKAREGRASREELTGSTFTITSLGKLGGLLATPILNYPEVGILGVHKLVKRPVVKGDQIVIGDVMNLSLSFDHRAIDGAVGASFCGQVIKYLENPDLLFVDGI